MLVKCPVCKYEFEINPDDVSVCLGDGVPFVSCRNPIPIADTRYRLLYCNTFIDLSCTVDNTVISSGLSKDCVSMDMAVKTCQKKE